MINVAVFSSGSGTNAENIIKYFSDNINFSVDIIVSNKPDAYVHQRARLLGVDSVTFSKTDFVEAYPVLNLLEERNIDFIVLAGFLLKISPVIVEKYPNRIVNIHPALLPKFGGKGMYGDNVHKAVKQSGEKETGITVHYVNENYDEGNIIFQAKCDVLVQDDYKSIADKVHQLEYKHFPQVIEKVLQKEFSKQPFD